MKDLRCPVFAEDLRLDGGWRDVESAAQMYPKALAVEHGTGTEDAVVACQLPRQIGEGIGRIGQDEQHGVGTRRDDLRSYIAINRDVLVEQAQPPLRIAAIGRSPGLL